VLLAEKSVSVPGSPGGTDLGDSSASDKTTTNQPYGAFFGYATDSIRWATADPVQDPKDPIPTPASATIQAQRFGSAHPGGLNVAFADGRVSTVIYGANFTFFQYACNRDNRNAFDLSAIE
jgi:prepilin-type processing-associated H-X9-DG protein